MISQKKLREAYARHPEWMPGLVNWYTLAKRAQWGSLMDVRATMPSCDGVPVARERVLTVFNISGNNCRLITKIEYGKKLVFILDVLTHEEYDRGAWKE